MTTPVSDDASLLERALIETDRLALRPLRPDDTDLLLQIFSDPKAMEFYPGTKSRRETDRWIADNLRSYEEYGHGMWAVFVKQSGAFVGQVGFTRQQVDGVAETELGYLLVRKAWGRGLASEAARACLDFAFHTLRKPRLISLIDERNRRSRRLAERIGMQLEREIDKWNKPVCVYAITSHLTSPALRIETDRLWLRPYRSEDFDDLQRLWTDPQVRRYLLDDVVVSGDWVREEIESSHRCFLERGFGQWGVFRAGSSALIGFCGFRFFHQETEPQLLYGLHPSVWGRGFASEAARAMIRRGFEEDGFERIVASADAPNTASLRVMEQAGLEFDRRVMEHGLDTIYYSLSRGRFAARAGAVR